MAHRLSREGFEKARAFIDREGRTLDRALLAYHLGQAPAEPAITALGAYQNPDGGFGHGLEPDTTARGSTAIATASACACSAPLASTAAIRGCARR
jgi:hypothetical protein